MGVSSESVAVRRRCGQGDAADLEDLAARAWPENCGSSCGCSVTPSATSAVAVATPLGAMSWPSTEA